MENMTANERQKEVEAKYPTVKEIVIKYLEEHGLDGLFHPGECACKTDDLFPCGEPAYDCRPGWLSPCPDECGEHEYHIGWGE